MLRNIGITHLNRLVVPHLRYLDISHNSISEWETCEAFFNRTPLLEVLLINNNAVSLRENFLEKVLSKRSDSFRIASRSTPQKSAATALQSMIMLLI